MTSTAPPPATIRFVIVCTTLGRNMGREMGVGAYCAKGLLEVANKLLVNFWVDCARGVPRLGPVSSKVFVLCNDVNYEDYARWGRSPKLSGADFPVENIVSNGSTSQTGLAADLDAFVKATGGAPTDLVVVEADYLFHPQFNLQRIVEHAMIRAKDTVTYLALRDFETQAGHKVLHMAPNSAGVNPKVQSIVAFPGPGESESLAAVAPLYVFRKNTVAKIISEFLTSCTAPGPVEQNAQLLAWLPTAVPVYALNVGHVFDVKTFDSYHYLDNLFAFYNRNVNRPAGDAQGSKPRKPTGSLDFATSEPGGDLTRRLVEDARLATGMTRSDPQALDPGAGDLETLIFEFQDRYENFAQARSSGLADVPERFGDASLWKHKAKSQHPVYTTTNHTYGYKMPCNEELPSKFCGIKGQFTAEFPIISGRPSMFGDNGFVCATTTSKVHKLFDD